MAEQKNARRKCKVAEQKNEGGRAPKKNCLADSKSSSDLGRKLKK
jgi:hypothetical protein